MLLLLALAALPILTVVQRAVFGSSSPLAIPLVQHLNLVLCFAGAILAAREQKLLRLATGEFLEKTAWGRRVEILTGAVSCAVVGLLAGAAANLVLFEREGAMKIGDAIPVWVALTVIPAALFLIGLRLAWATADRRLVRLACFVAMVAGIALTCPYGLEPNYETKALELFGGGTVWPLVLLLVAMALLGAPLFVPLAGCALILFLSDGVSATIVPLEMYQLAARPFLPAIPLFTLAGFLIAEGAAPRRLLDVFRAAFGWIPGGTAVVAVLLCAFLSIFTGGSGVTILALGGLLLPALSQDGYAERFSIGILTASGSLGILLPPALPLILFGIAAEVPVQDLFRAGVVPGLLLIGLVAAWGVRAGWKQRIPRTPFRGREVLRTAWAARYELLLPVLPLVALFSGRATLVEAASLTALYTLVIQVFVRREISWRSRLPAVLVECGALLGGVLIILCAATSLSYYMVDAQIPMRLLEWMQGAITSPWVFLLCVNLFLLVVGCFLDIYSATFVVVPLLLPLGAAYGIDPVHLGIVFVANLELGYLTPPIGLNLFLASYRFERPLLAVYRAALPLLLILGVGVLVITYAPLVFGD